MGAGAGVGAGDGVGVGDGAGVVLVVVVLGEGAGVGGATVVVVVVVVVVLSGAGVVDEVVVEAGVVEVVVELVVVLSEAFVVVSVVLLLVVVAGVVVLVSGASVDDVSGITGNASEPLCCCWPLVLTIRQETAITANASTTFRNCDEDIIEFSESGFIGLPAFLRLVLIDRREEIDRSIARQLLKSGQQSNGGRGSTPKLPRVNVDDSRLFRGFGKPGN